MIYKIAQQSVSRISGLRSILVINLTMSLSIFISNDINELMMNCVLK